MTDEEQEVIDAAKAWNHYPDEKAHNRLEEALDALPKPYESLVSDEELVVIYARAVTSVDAMRNAMSLGLRRMSERLAVVGYEGASNMVARASQEEKVQ